MKTPRLAVLATLEYAVIAMMHATPKEEENSDKANTHINNFLRNCFVYIGNVEEAKNREFLLVFAKGRQSSEEQDTNAVTSVLHLMIGNSIANEDFERADKILEYAFTKDEIEDEFLEENMTEEEKVAFKIFIKEEQMKIMISKLKEVLTPDNSSKSKPPSFEDFIQGLHDLKS